MSTSVELKGVVKNTLEPVQITDNLKKKEIWLEIDGDGKYPQTVSIEFINDNIDKTVISKYSVGDEIEVSTNIRGNVYNERCYVSLQGWRVRGVASGGGETSDPGPSDGDDVPF
jgi:hypothetical protein